MLYFIGWSLFFIFFKLFLNVKVYGRENVPKKGAFIFVSNHMSYLDPPLLGTSVYRSLNYMARDTLFKRPRFGRIMRGIHAFPVKRGRSDFTAIREALRILAEGKPLVIFPEGTRSKDKFLRPAKPGIGFIVSKANVPVVPAYIEGSYDALPRGPGTFRRRPVRVYIGKPVDFGKSYMGGKGKELYKKLSDDIMRGIAQLKELHS